VIQKGKENEFVTSYIDKDNLTTPEQNLNEVEKQKKNQKQKKLNPRGRRNVVPDNAVAGPKTFSKDDSLSPTKAQCLAKSAGETNEKPLNRCIEYVDLESSSIISR